MVVPSLALDWFDNDRHSFNGRDDPVFAGFLPAPGSRAEARFSACTDRVQQIVNARPGMGYLNLRVDDASTRDVNRFVEVTHYDEATARAIVPKIAAAILHMASSN